MSDTTTEITPEARAAAVEELRRIVADLYDAFATGDAAPWISRLSGEHVPTGYGTDPTESWSGRDELTAVIEAQAGEMSAAGFSLRSGSPVFDGHSDVAWMIDEPTLRTGDGTDIPMRLTVLFTCEDDAWRVAHFHLSVGVPNESLLDATLTVSPS
jgi:SnoaL-like domain